MIGHLLGAAGAVEFITCVKELEEGYIHRTVGYETPDDEMDLNYCKEESHESFTYALSNSLGFGGHNAVVAFKKYEKDVLRFNLSSRVFEIIFNLQK